MKAKPTARKPVNVEPGPRRGSSPRFIVKLYVAGQSPKSVCAIANIKRLCEAKLPGQYELDVIDLYQQPHLAKGEEIIAVPTLVRHFPSPICRLIGDMSNTERVLAALGIQEM